jgi:alpha-2-macroglobulin
VVSTTANVTPLDAQATQALLARMEPLPAIDNRSAPVVRPPSQPPPRSGTVQPIAFVAPTGKQVVDKPITPVQSLAPLAAPQVLPIGEVERESEIRVRFEEPMVPVAAVGSAAKLPITFKPAIAGSWRWIDTRVAQFTSQAARLPAATEFTVTVATGAKAISGATLMSNVTATFSTPPVKITGTYPTVQLRPDSPIAIKFDQAVDADAVRKFLRVERGKQKLAWQPTTLDSAAAAWAKNPSVKFSAAELGPYYIVLAPKSAWPAGIEGRVTLAKKAPSREGPRLSARETSASFTIAKAFSALGVQCDDMRSPKVSGATCAARNYLSVEFTNPIDVATYRSSKVQIEGQPLHDHMPSHDSVTLWTPGSVGREFAIPIGSGIRDVYGQDLVGPRRLAFTTGRERFAPYLWAADGMFVLDPRFDIPQWIIHTQSIATLRVQLFQVEPKDYFAFADFEAGKRSSPPGKKVYDKEHAVGMRNGATARVDLRPALSATGSGHLIALATATAGGQKLATEDKRRVAWIQVSRVGVTARLDGEKVHAWTQDITPSRFLSPIPGVKATLLVDGRTDAASATTDTEGHASFALMKPKPHKVKDDAEWYDVDALLLVQQGDQSTFTPIQSYEQAVREQHARWYVTDDRFTYKPGEPVYVKGWVRWTHTGVNPDLALPAAKDKLDYTLTDSRGNKIASGHAAMTAQGGFDLEVALPPNVNLGTAYFTFETNGGAHRHPISIQEFRTPAYAVTLDDDVTHSGATPVVLGESIEMSAEAKYYAGGGLGGADIKWNATLTQATYRPPGWDRYSFSPIRKRSDGDYYSRYRGGNHATSVEQETSLSGASTAGITFGLAALPAGEPSVLTVDATVTDIDRQAIRASSRPILVHPSTLYVGMRLMPEDERTLQLVATDIDGNAVAGVPIEVTIEGVLGSERYRDDAVVIDTQHCKTTSATTPVTCTFTRRDVKTAYVAVARVADSRGRVNAVQYYIPWWMAADAEFAVIADKQMYKPGDVAKLDVRSKQLPSVALVSFARNGIILQKRVELTKPSTIVELPIDKAFVPNVHVVVDRWAKRTYLQSGSNLPLPEHLSAQVELGVDLQSARLAMRTRPLQSLVEPGAPATFEVEVKHDDKPVAGAEVALMVVDEAILALSAKNHEDPLASFYSAVDHGTWATSTLGLVQDEGDELAGVPGFERWSLDDGTHSGFGSGGGYGSGSGTIGTGRYGTIGHGSGTSIVKARKDFRATAVFSPKLLTDARGKVRLTVKMPDSLTRFRVVALATADTRYFGKAENAIVTQRKVNARTVAPRFLSQGDIFSLPIVVQNLDTAPRTIDVAVRAANLTLAGPAGKRVTVPGGQRAEVRFELSTHERGRAVIQTIAVSGAFADASNVELPVYEPATTESFATYGTVDDKPQFEQLKVPANIFTSVGGVEAEVSSTQLQNLTDAYWYLYAYPFECAEQRSSRMIATTAMFDILDAFATPGRPSKQELAEQRARDVKKLTRDQLADGGWGYFRGMQSDPFVTMQVLTALALQKEQGAIVKHAVGYVTKQANQLQAKLDKLVKARDAQHTADGAYTVSLLAASLTALAATGTDIAARADKLHASATELGVYPIDAKARVLAIIAKQDKRKPMRDKLLADLLAAVHETAGAATVTTQYSESERLLLVSNHKTTALALDAIMREQPQHSLVTKLARGLLDGRRRGRWLSTQENVVVLQTMRRYFDLYEKDTPNYTGKLWFGNAAYAEQSFAGRSTARGVSQLDWSTLAPGSTHDLVMAKSGPGRMYYRIGITYAPKQTNLPALDAGFVVRRTYRGVDDPKDVVQLPDGRVKIKLGARVLVQLEAINTSLRYAVALVDPLPAGLEPVNTNLATSERAAAGTTSNDWQHIEMRDNRSEAFSMHLAEGTHHFAYTARATIPGTFVAAPAKAEEMYSPETFGRSAGTTVVVE